MYRKPPPFTREWCCGNLAARGGRARPVEKTNHPPFKEQEGCMFQKWAVLFLGSSRRWFLADDSLARFKGGVG